MFNRFWALIQTHTEYYRIIGFRLIGPRYSLVISSVPYSNIRGTNIIMTLRITGNKRDGMLISMPSTTGIKYPLVTILEVVLSYPAFCLVLVWLGIRTLVLRFS